jgi:hypothetical protein
LAGRAARAREQNAFLTTHSCDEYAAWHLGLTEGAAEETKARYAFVYSDFRRLHRMARDLSQNLLDGLSAGQRPRWTLVDAAWTSEGSSAAHRDNETSG